VDFAYCAHAAGFKVTKKDEITNQSRKKKTGHCQLTHEEFSHNKVAKWALARKG